MKRPIAPHEIFGTQREAARYVLDTKGDNADAGSQRLRAGLTGGFELLKASHVTSDLVHYDTFDLRLLSARQELARNGSTWRLLDLESEAELTMVLEPPPVLSSCVSARAEVFPYRDRSALSIRVHEHTGDRTAIALMWEREYRDRYRVVDGAGKTHAVLERCEWVDTGAPSSSGGVVVWSVRPLRGYALTARRICDQLSEHGRRSSFAEVLALRMERSDPAPSYHWRRPDVEGDTQESANTAVSRIGLHLLEVMEEQVPGILLRLDPEFLHDYRVTLRRLRTVVSALKTVFPEDEGELVRRLLRSLWNLTGSARDLDVLHESWDRYRQLIAPSLQSDLEPLIHYTDQRREDGYGALHEYICSGGHGRDLDVLRSCFRELADGAAEDEVTNESGTTAASKPIRVEAANALLKRVKKIRKRIHRLDESNEASFHELRVQCKKLRYLLEVFGELFAGKELRRFTKDLKAVQTVLGTLNDYTVQQETLGAFLHEMPATSPRSAAAVGAVITKLEEEKISQQKTARAKLAKHIHHLDDSVWLALFRSAAEGGGAS